MESNIGVGAYEMGGCSILVGEILIRGYSIGYLPGLGLVGLAIDTSKGGAVV